MAQKMGSLQKKEHAMLLTKLHNKIYNEFIASGTVQSSSSLLAILVNMNIKQLKFHLEIKE